MRDSPLAPILGVAADGNGGDFKCAVSQRARRHIRKVADALQARGLTGRDDRRGCCGNVRERQPAQCHPNGHANGKRENHTRRHSQRSPCEEAPQ